MSSPFLSSFEREDPQRGREALCKLLGNYQRLKGHRVTVVFDAKEGLSLSPKEERIHGIKVVYPPRGKTADEWIMQKISSSTHDDVVVTSDREIIRYVEAHGGHTITSHEFLSKVEMAEYIAMKGSIEEDDHDPTSLKKKGPSKRLPKRKRKRLKSSA